MSPLTVHLWFDEHAVDAARFYCELFSGARFGSQRKLTDTPSGDVDLVSFELPGQRFQAINAGPMFTINPSVSFMAACPSAEEVDRLWAALVVGGTAMMELGTYPWSDRYGWVADRFGVSWQLIRTDDRTVQPVTPCLLFTGAVCGKVEEAIARWSRIFPESGLPPGRLSRYGEGHAPNRPEMVNHARFRLLGGELVAMESALDHGFGFNEAVSFMVSCESQGEVDRYWDALIAGGGAPSQCGWLKDPYGVSWQIVPTALPRLMASPDPEVVARVTRVMLTMAKLDVAGLEAAARGD